MGLSVLKADSVVRYVCGHCTLSVSCSLTSVFFFLLAFYGTLRVMGMNQVTMERRRRGRMV